MFLMMSVSLSAWKSAGWSAWQIGLAMTLTNLGYGGLVGQGGRLADHWGKAKTGIFGAALGTLGCLLVSFLPGSMTAMAGTLMAFAGGAFFFPACAGLFSDSQTAAHLPPTPLHQKISGYNLGWSSGNLLGFVAFGLLAGFTLSVNALVPAAGYALVGLSLWRWRNLPSQPPPSQGDRADHPALEKLIFMSRANLFIVSVACMGQLALLEKALGHLDPLQARHLSSLNKAFYSTGYVSMFLLMGRWTGWILKPWVLWLCQAGLLLGPLGLWLLGGDSPHLPLLLAACGLLLGWGYGSAYTGSIYYSLRLPQGASRAAGLHETWLGLGNTAGPLLGGLFMAFCPASAGGSGLPALGLFILLCSLAALSFQALRIPSIPLE